MVPPNNSRSSPSRPHRSACMIARQSPRSAGASNESPPGLGPVMGGTSGGPVEVKSISSVVQSSAPSVKALALLIVHVGSRNSRLYSPKGELFLELRFGFCCMQQVLLIVYCTKSIAPSLWHPPADGTERAELEVRAMLPTSWPALAFLLVCCFLTAFSHFLPNK